MRTFGSDVTLPLKYWVIFPMIRRTSWTGRFGEARILSTRVFVCGGIEASQLAHRLGGSDRVHSMQPINTCPLEQLQCVWRAFGDTSVLYCAPDEREQRRTGEGTLGEQFDEAAEAYKQPVRRTAAAVGNELGGWSSTHSRRCRKWQDHCLGQQSGACLERRLIAASEDLFGAQSRRPRLLAVCFNRSLAPFIREEDQHCVSAAERSAGSGWDCRRVVVQHAHVEAGRSPACGAIRV